MSCNIETALSVKVITQSDKRGTLSVRVILWIERALSVKVITQRDKIGTLYIRVIIYREHYEFICGSRNTKRQESNVTLSVKVIIKGEQERNIIC